MSANLGFLISPSDSLPSNFLLSIYNQQSSQSITLSVIKLFTVTHVLKFEPKKKKKNITMNLPTLRTAQSSKHSLNLDRVRRVATQTP